MDLTTLRYADQKLRGVRASLAQRRDVIAALSGYKASRLILTDRGIRFLKVLLNETPFGLSIGREHYQLSRTAAKGGFSNSMLPAIKGRREVFLSRDLSLAPLLTRRRNDHLFIGDSLKIPACCVEFYLAQSEQAAERGFDYSGLIRTPVSLEAPLLSNTLARYFDRGIVDHFPCRYDCRKTAVVARQLMDILRSVDKPLAVNLVAEGTFIYSDDQGVFWLAPLSEKGKGDCRLKEATTNGTDLAKQLRSASTVTTLRDRKGGVTLELCGSEHSTPFSVFESMKVVTFRSVASDCANFPELASHLSCR